MLNVSYLCVRILLIFYVALSVAVLPNYCCHRCFAGDSAAANERTDDWGRQMDPEEKEKMEKRDWLAEKIQMLNTQLEGFEADVEKAVSTCTISVVL